MEDRHVQRQTPLWDFWHISLASSCSGKMNIGFICRQVSVTRTPLQSPRVAQEVYYLITVSYWEDWPSATGVCMRCEGCIVAVMPTPSFRTPESQGKLLKLNQGRYINTSHRKRKLENMSHSTEMHGMLY